MEKCTAYNFATEKKILVITYGKGIDNDDEYCTSSHPVKQVKEAIELIDEINEDVTKIVYYINSNATDFIRFLVKYAKERKRFYVFLVKSNQYSSGIEEAFTEFNESLDLTDSLENLSKDLSEIYHIQ